MHQTFLNHFLFLEKCVFLNRFVSGNHPSHTADVSSANTYILFFKGFISLFLESWEGRGKERERNINVWLPLVCPLLVTWPATQACTLDWVSNQDPLVRRPAPNPLSYTSQGNTYILYNYPQVALIHIPEKVVENYYLSIILLTSI